MHHINIVYSQIKCPLSCSKCKFHNCFYFINVDQIWAGNTGISFKNV